MKFYEDFLGLWFTDDIERVVNFYTATATITLSSRHHYRSSTHYVLLHCIPRGPIRWPLWVGWSR
jgi:hypothetical protein